MKPNSNNIAPLAWASCLAALAVWLGNAACVRAGQIVMGPYLQNANRTAVTVLWWTDFSTASGSSRVEYGEGLSNIVPAVETEEASFGAYAYRFKQQATVTNLAGNQTYSYRVASAAGSDVATSDAFTFSTAPTRFQNLHFAFLGDGRTDNATVTARHKMVLAQALTNGAQMILYGGDMVYSGSSTSTHDEHWKTFFTDVVCGGGSQTGSGVGNVIPVYMLVGNHEIYRHGAVDYYGDGQLMTSMARFKAVCANPPNESANPNWEERYYAFAYGPCYFLCLDANNTSDNALDNHTQLNDGATPDWEPGSEQYMWMTNHLAYAQHRFPFTFVSFHPAPYSRGTHGDPGERQSGYQLRALDPVFRQYGVDAVFASHDHFVERCVTGPDGFHTNFPGGMTDPLTWQDEENLNYMVQGNSGQSSRGAEAGWQDWMDITGNGGAPYYTAYFYTWAGVNTLSSFHDMDITWNPTNRKWHASFQVIQTDVAGQTSVHDPFVLERADPLRIQSVRRDAESNALLRIDWEGAPEDVTIEEATSLAPSDWHPADHTATGTTFYISLPPADGPTFFRLSGE